MTASPRSAAAVCERASLSTRSARRRPLTTRIGFLRDTRRAIRVNRSGLPNVSTYRITAAVRSSCSQHSSRSLVETSARLPSETNIETPSCRAAARPSSPIPTAPDGEPIASAPARTRASLNVAFRLTSAAVFSTPNELGPTSRKPPPRTISSSRSSRARAASPSSRTGGENEQRSRSRRGRLGGELEHLIARDGDDHELRSDLQLSEAAERPASSTPHPPHG